MNTIHFYVPGIGKTVAFPKDVAEARSMTRELMANPSVTAIEVKLLRADDHPGISLADVHRWSRKTNVWHTHTVDADA